MSKGSITDEKISNDSDKHSETGSKKIEKLLSKDRIEALVNQTNKNKLINKRLPTTVSAIVTPRCK